MNNIVGKWKKRWAFIGLGVVVVSFVVMVSTDCFDEITMPNTIYASLTMLLMFVGCIATAVVNTIVWMERINSKKDK